MQVVIRRQVFTMQKKISILVQAYITSNISNPTTIGLLATLLHFHGLHYWLQ